MTSKQIRCHDCGVKEGQLHKVGCNVEVCPKCMDMKVKCDCKLKDSEKEPFFHTGHSCMRCGKFMPEMKMVTNQLWNRICGMTYPKDCFLCGKCMDFILKERLRK